MTDMTVPEVPPKENDVSRLVRELGLSYDRRTNREAAELIERLASENERLASIATTKGALDAMTRRLKVMEGVVALACEALLFRGTFAAKADLENRIREAIPTLKSS